MAHENCKYLLASLSDYIDGDLETQVCAELERHIAGCENCRVVVDTLRKTVNLYQHSKEPAPAMPSAVRERLYQCLELDDLLKR